MEKWGLEKIEWLVPDHTKYLQQLETRPNLHYHVWIAKATPSFHTAEQHLQSERRKSVGDMQPEALSSKSLVALLQDHPCTSFSMSTFNFISFLPHRTSDFWDIS